MDSPRILCAINEVERADFLPRDLWERVESLPLPVEWVSGDWRDGEHLAEYLIGNRVEVLVSGWSTPCLPDGLPVGECGSLKYLCHLTGSVKNVLPRAVLERGFKVTNWGASASRTVAECGLLLILSALRRSSHWAVAMHRDGLWKDRYGVKTESLFGRTVGLHGFGAVARELVQLMKPFGVQVSTHTLGVTDEQLAAHDVRRMNSIEELFSSNDVIVEVAALTPETRGCVDERILRLIRPGSVFVNIGRGAIVDEAALARVAAEGAIQVALDVYAVEPLPVSSPLRGLPNVTLLPHIAGPTKDRRRDCGEVACRNLENYFAGRPLEAVVNLEIFDQTT